jgi:hypothetical protein
MNTPIGGIIIGVCICGPLAILGIFLAFFKKAKKASGGSVHTRDGKNAIAYNYEQPISYD